jgi:hypothetical protein
MITSSEMQQQRSPQALRDFVVGLKDSVSADKAELNRGILKKGLYKEFLDEMVPLSIFALQIYPEHYGIQLVLGNQGYDALIFDETGIEVDRVEMTIPHDGNAKAKDARLVVNRGYGQVEIGIPGDDFDALFPHVLAVCQKKAAKDYGDCTLVIAIEPWPPFASFESKHEKQIEALVSKMEKMRFKAKRVFLLVLPDRVIAVNGLHASPK